MQLRFCEYEAWMKEQVIEMFCKEYGNNKSQFTEYYDRFYSTFQENKAIRLVILDENVVAGFVSFSYWPYFVKGKITNSYQCGNVIINENYRGKGLYNQLLNYLNDNSSKYKIDFIIGFPIKQILKLYLKSEWKNPFNLNWYVQVINPLGKLFKVSDTKLKTVFKSEKEHINTNNPDGKNILNVDEPFYNWNRNYNNLGKHYYFSFSESGDFIEFGLKLNERKYLNELIIGEINTNSQNVVFLNKAIKQLRKKARKIMGVSMLSICINDNYPGNVIQSAITGAGFKKIERDIKFIVKNFSMPESDLLNPSNWALYRRDIDTW